MKKEPVRNPYNYDSDELSRETGLYCPEPTLTAQEFLEESDINYIADKFLRTGEIRVIPNLPTPGDFEGIFDFQSAMNTIVAARTEFMKLPAKVRTRFNNDPAQLLDFIHNLNDDTRPEAEALGLVNKKERKNEAGTGGTPETTTQGKAGTAGTATDTRGPQTPEKS